MENKSDFTLSSTEESLHPYYTLGEIVVFFAKKNYTFYCKTNLRRQENLMETVQVF